MNCLTQSTQQPNDVGTVTKPLLQMRKLKHSICHSHLAILEPEFNSVSLPAEHPLLTIKLDYLPYILYLTTMNQEAWSGFLSLYFPFRGWWGVGGSGGEHFVLFCFVLKEKLKVSLLSF